MEKEPQDDLEMFIHQELRRLPGLEAPAELMLRVQASLQARTRLRWWQRSWWSWPRALRALSISLFASLGLASCLAPWFLPAGFLTETVTRWRLELAGQWQWVDALGGALAVLARALAGSPYVWLVAGVSVVGYFMVIGLGAFLVRFAGRPGYRGVGL